MPIISSASPWQRLLAAAAAAAAAADIVDMMIPERDNVDERTTDGEHVAMTQTQTVSGVQFGRRRTTSIGAKAFCPSAGHRVMVSVKRRRLRGSRASSRLHSIRRRCGFSNR